MSVSVFIIIGTDMLTTNTVGLVGAKYFPVIILCFVNPIHCTFSLKGRCYNCYFVSFLFFTSTSSFPLSLDSLITLSSDSIIPCSPPSVRCKLNLYNLACAMILVNHIWKPSTFPLNYGILTDFSLDNFSILSVSIRYFIRRKFYNEA